MISNLVSKNNVGGATALLLVVLLSQSKFFNFLLDTALGRALLILFILVISYTNKILGVVSVLFIIIMANSSDIGYLEGFDTPTDLTASSDNSTTKDSTTSSTKPNKTTPDNSTTPPQKQEHGTSPDSTPSAITTATEGFNTLDTERNIQKGKQSNSIAVDNISSKSSSNVAPFDGGAQFGIF
jgi:hypothetical protein